MKIKVSASVLYTVEKVYCILLLVACLLLCLPNPEFIQMFGSHSTSWKQRPLLDAREASWLVSASRGRSFPQRYMFRKGPESQFGPVRPERCLPGHSGKSTTPLKSHSGKGLFVTVMRVYAESGDDSLKT